ncbi:hypothetical protein Lupro_06175 [Lutibacter profundi]|uniref:UDP-GlcNAc--UDP-phosphate GlcNAc-1-phosphate transferase n=1 Tax=Lutibacter profundi TaxID=1622118 RepID=A0A0X8G742_9FLAO|nr:glycosyltransferase family 4 protein [Lutibacter profundi]AMC10853.1 hypothetical protein Lupro_06175 [Lutibacter profundi]
MEYIISTLSLIFCAVIYIKLAQKYNIVDNPNFRSSHTLPTIRGGGILFYIAILLFFISSKFQYPYFIAGVSLIALLSFLDDLISLSPKIRLPFQFIAVFLLLIELQMHQHPIWLLALLLVIGVGFVNTYNFMDGINGITGLYSLAVLGGLFFINVKEQFIDSRLIVFSIIALLVFGYYNFRKKARFFAGDIGSITIAMLILFLVLKFIVHLQAPVLVLLVLVYGVDGVLTILYRMCLKESITQAHRHHIYQKLVDKAHWSHLKVAGVYALVQLLLNVVVIYSYQLAFIAQLGIVVAIVLSMAICYLFVFNTLKK